MAEFGALNWSILVIYVIANLGLGFFLGKKIHSADDFFLGDRSIPWWAIGISVVSTYVSALTFLGGPAWSYTDGLSVIAIHLNYPLVIFFVVTFFLPFFFNSGVASIYEYQEKRFGPASRSVMSGVFLLSQGLTSAAVLYATSLVLEFITGLPVEYCIAIVTLIALIYTSLGGIAAVIWTDVIQAGILFVGAFVILFALLGEMPVPVAEALAQLKAQGRTDALDFSVDMTRVTTVWSGVIAMTLFHVTVYGANQMMVQRTLAAKNIGDAKKSFLMMGFGAFFIYFLFILLGVLFYSYYGGREFENGNTIILQFATDYGLPGLMGLIAAAVLAASMSSLDSAFNSMSTVSTVDFYQRYFKPGESGEHYLKVSRLFTVFWAVMIVIPALMFAESEGSVLETLSKVGSYFVGAKLSMFALGFFSKHTTERGLLIGVAVGFVVIWYVATNTDIAWPWYCAIGGAVNISVSLLASLALDGRQEEYSPYTVVGQKAQFAAEGRPEKEGNWYLIPGRVDRVSYYLLGLFILTVVFLYLFNAMIG
ncbi:sodium/solute symporter [Pseudohalioglobus sediminis]|uniref:Sodium/solute symporter n=1 Tax=Pseudohalioglobus sediminis TaxID=2606449 RepID=A0A5B0WS11_9GAMM|nr:sodium:solute symporter [Pseudohalioglobus sediminis]KAA1189125.1 sodium/solute symporter [Pseudohalioglobus sediminis]